MPFFKTMRMKTRWIAVLITAVLLGSCNEPKTYVPIEAFEPSYKALQGAQGDNYDIEETVRILNGIELAQAQSEDFHSFLNYMARQDYSQVAQEVVDMRVQLLPILQEMYLLDQEYENLNMWSSLCRELSSDISQAATQEYAESSTDLHGLITAIGSFSIGTMAVSTFVKAGEGVFKQYEKHQKLKGDIQKRMQHVCKDYLEYLEDYIPVYNKYMQEWNQLCLIKDRAYLNLYAGQNEAALKACQEALQMNPNNREMQLIQSMSIIQSVSSAYEFTDAPVHASDGNITETNPDIIETNLQVANKLLDDYLSRWPDQSAPALLQKGLICAIEGNIEQAIVYCNQSAMEYPRQAERLTDMLSSYRARTYLNHTAEGSYLLSLYQSTMEGFGMFSPNFTKAKLYEQSGNFRAAKDEIFNHFFRRSNQSVYDCMLSDMEYCEENLSYIFKQLLPESSYMDVSIKRAAKVMGMGNNDKKLKVSLSNRCDKAFENLRVFLCFHFTDMYKTDYHVVRVPTLNRINGKEKVELGTIELNYNEKSFNDITRVRAIVLTDNRICWIDNVTNDELHINYNPIYSTSMVDVEGSSSINQYRHYWTVTNEASFSTLLRHNTNIQIEDNSTLFKHNSSLHIRLPRMVIMLNPTYVLNDDVVPTNNYLQGENVHLVFENIQLQDDNILTIKSPYASYNLNFVPQKDTHFAVTKVDTISAY